MVEVSACTVTVMVSDLSRAIKFYCGLLELELSTRHADDWADINGPGLSISLHQANKTVKRGHNLQIGLFVEGFDAAIDAFKEHDVPFQLQERGNLQMAFFSDPDGNVLYIVEASSE